MKNKIVFLIFLSIFVFSPGVIFSADQTVTPPADQTVTPPTSGIYKIKIPSPLKICSGATPGAECTIPGLLKVIISDIIIPIGGVVAALMIMYAGFLYVTAGGNETQIKKAHDALLWGAIGAAVLLGAYVIATAIQGTINQLGVPV